MKDSRKVDGKFLDGLIIELKSLSPQNLEYFDRINSVYGAVPKIYVLTPAGYRLLSEKRKAKVDHSLIVLSEVVSLDYLIQLPRLIEEVGLKRKLKMQNERLQKLISKKMPMIEASQARASSVFVRNLLNDDLQQGLRVTLNSWTTIKRKLGSDAARAEVLEVFGRLIGGVIRQSDRVLHSNENEFLIFLSNASKVTIERCKNRLEESLRLFNVSADDQELDLPFQIAPLEVEKSC